MGKTLKNLQGAFAGESQANRRYLAFAMKADKEGFPQVAKLFRAAADAETVHAFAHLRVMEGVKSTEENLVAATAGEAEEFKKMYPAFIKDAEAEGNEAAAMSFRNANAVEEIHYGLYSEALKAVKEKKDLPRSEIYVCQVCGNTVTGEAPETCPVCGAPKSRFKKVD